MHGQDRRVLVAGHLRLDAPLRDLCHAQAKHLETIRDATLSAFEFLVESAFEQAVDAVLLLGQLLDEHPTPRACSTFRDGIEALREEGIEVLWAAPSSAEPNLLKELNCLPPGVVLLNDANPQAAFLANRETRMESRREVVRCDLMDPHSLPSREWDGHETQTLLRIGITQRPIGHLAQGDSLGGEPDRQFQLVLSSSPDRTHTTRHQQTIYHAPGCLQGLDASLHGPCSATLLRIGPDGSVELLSLETSRVRREHIEFSCDASVDEPQLLEQAELELLELFSQVDSGPARLLHIHWNIRGTLDWSTDWSSEKIQETLANRLPHTPSGIPLLHSVQRIPLMSGQIVACGEFLEEHLAEQYLQQLGEQLASDTSQDLEQACRELFLAHERSTHLPWQQLLAESSLRILAPRAGELGVRALQDQSRAG
ncbi:MAG: hypothetical protein KDA76_06960 [Planctomycetaceae bacterium]|nr:hypothetical protein [Planctomycetaceae bacterium]